MDNAVALWEAPLGGTSKAMRVGFLGTAGAMTSGRRSGTSLVAAHGEEQLLVDCAGDPVGAMERAGCDWRRLEHVLLTA